VVDEIRKVAPWLLDPLYADAVSRYTRSEARARMLSHHVLKVASEDGVDKVPVRLWESCKASDRAANELARELGLTPTSRAALAALTVSAETGEVHLARLIDEGRAIVEARSGPASEGEEAVEL
jgi:phage terminase small subunit